MKIPMLTVVITTYNLEKYLEEALESVFNQLTKFSYEVLIGDDGSTDGTIDIIREWEKKYPDTISHYCIPRDHQEKCNPICRASRNRLMGLEAAHGRYITFLDGDDFYTDPGKFQKQISILEDLNNEDCFMCAHNIQLYFGSKKTSKGLCKLAEGKYKGDKFWQKNYVPAEACIIRNTPQFRELAVRMPDYFDDNIIVFIGLTLGGMYYIPDIMASYRQNDSPWKRNSEIRRETISSLDFYVETDINPKMLMSSCLRHYWEFRYLYKHKKRLDKEENVDLWRQAEALQAEMILDFYDYKNSCCQKKIKIIINFRKLQIKRVWYYLRLSGKCYTADRQNLK